MRARLLGDDLETLQQPAEELEQRGEDGEVERILARLVQDEEGEDREEQQGGDSERGLGGEGAEGDGESSQPVVSEESEIGKMMIFGSDLFI